MSRAATSLLLALTAACAAEEEAAPDEPSPEAVACAALTQDFTACGGDPVGRWALAQGCLAVRLDALDAEACPAELPGRLVGEGVLELRADGTMADGTSLEATVAAHVPTACVDALTQGALPAAEACALVPVEAERQGFSATCVFVGDCTCRLTGAVPSLGERRWVVDGGTLADPDDATVSAQFCVQGDGLTLRRADSSGVDVLLRFSREGT